MSNTSITGRGCVVASAAFAIGLLAPYVAQADLNIVGSTHGQNYQGVASPATGQAAASIPLTFCVPGTAERYQNLAGLIDPTGPQVPVSDQIVMPANSAIVWRCTLTAANGGNTNFLFRYTGGFSAKAYGHIRATLGSPESMFASMKPGGAGCASQGVKTDPGTGLQYTSFTGCTEFEIVPANFATTDTAGSDFASTMCDQNGNPVCAQPIPDDVVTSFPITATPFAVIVGNGVQKCTGGVAGGRITLTRAQVESIYDGSIKQWTQLGYCVFPVVPITPGTNGVGVGAGDMDTTPGLTPLAGAGSQVIVTCSRPITAGTRIIYDAVIQKDVPESSATTLGPPFAGAFHYLAPTVADGLSCVQGSSASPISTANMNAITYNRADEAASPVTFGLGNVGRMRGGYPVFLDGTLPSNYTVPLSGLVSPSDADRLASQKDFRCGRYEFWADWRGIQRNTPDSAQNESLWTQYVTAIGTLLPKTTTGYFWARNVRKPLSPVNTEMFIQKGATKGPESFNPGAHPDCN